MGVEQRSTRVMLSPTSSISRENKLLPLLLSKQLSAALFIYAKSVHMIPLQNIHLHYHTVFFLHKTRCKLILCSMYKVFCMDVYLGTIPFVNTRTFSFFATFTSFLCRFQKHEGKVFFLLKMMLQTSGCDFFREKKLRLR